MLERIGNVPSTPTPTPTPVPTNPTPTTPTNSYRITEPVNEAQEWLANLFSWNRNSGSTPPVDFFNGDSSNPNWIGTLNLGSNNENGNNSGSLKFDWGTGTVKGNSQLPADGFAIRAYTWADFDGGQYKFNVRADDGFQLLAKNQSTGQWFYITPQNQWQTSGYGTPSALSYALPAGRYDLHFHYFEHGGEAKMDLSWNKSSVVNPPNTQVLGVTDKVLYPLVRTGVGIENLQNNFGVRVTHEDFSTNGKETVWTKITPEAGNENKEHLVVIDWGTYRWEGVVNLEQGKYLTFWRESSEVVPITVTVTKYGQGGAYAKEKSVTEKTKIEFGEGEPSVDASIILPIKGDMVKMIKMTLFPSMLLNL
ncbi:hypothetical protein [Trichormus sp. NMC-1]|uniref:hypothetical protein n=1 Tax=Trichormus sp. NMC-1 TaxID=1853259 RepID=UPI0008DBF85C|nr:hypothetical protein [Trichormus sp. NMC-1]